jgi:hypothetical protein
MSEIVVVNFNEFDDEFIKFPLLLNLKQTLSLCHHFSSLPELWKLDKEYIEIVSEYLQIRTSQVEFIRLWDISIDYSKTVGLITNDKFFPVIRLK